MVLLGDQQPEAVTKRSYVIALVLPDNQQKPTANTELVFSRLQRVIPAKNTNALFLDGIMRHNRIKF